jgi:glycosyltransferase involved in cell wall biosynthesis
MSEQWFPRGLAEYASTSSPERPNRHEQFVAVVSQNKVSPCISVIIPLFNKARYVQRAVQSVLEQDYSDFELLVIDDGSTDGSSHEIECFAGNPRFRLILQPNGGDGSARNRGLTEMNGEIAAFLDADDEWLPTHLQDLALLANTFIQAGLFATRFAYVRENNIFAEETISCDVPILVQNYFEIASRDVYILNSSSCAIRKSVVARLGFFSEGTPYGADVEYWGRISLRYPLAYHPRLSSLYYLGLPDSAMSHSKRKPFDPPVIRTIKDYLGSNPVAENKQDIIDYAAWTIMNMAATGISSGYAKEARGMLGDPLLDECRFQRRLQVLRYLSCLPPALASKLCRLHTMAWASKWHELYQNFTRPSLDSIGKFSAQS